MAPTDPRILAIHRASTEYAESWAGEDGIRSHARAKAAEIGCVAMGPGAGSIVRTLAAAIDAKNVVEIGTHEPLDYSSKSFLNLVGKTSIEETCTLIKSARFFLGIDSGPTHIANAFKIPALILCGHFANFKKYMSYSGAYQVKGGIANIYFNASGSTRELPFLEVWEELQKTILNIKSLALKAV